MSVLPQMIAVRVSPRQTAVPIAGEATKSAAMPQMISPSATNPELTQLGYKNVFRLLANDNELGAGLARHAQQVLKLQKVAIIDDKSPYGKGLADERNGRARQ